MSATVIAANIVRDWDELSKDSPVNRETVLRNILISFAQEVEQNVIVNITEEIKP